MRLCIYVGSPECHGFHTHKQLCIVVAKSQIDCKCSPAGKGLNSWLSFVKFKCVFVTFPCGILDQVWYLIVSIPDL